jgi:FkbM family methyltransferase
LYHYLKFSNGFFVEVGANDGIKQSNTLYYEKYLNWRGILIEPIPHLASKCKVNRPKAIIENFALVPFSHQENEIEMRYCGLMSIVKGAMKSENEEINHVREGCKSQKIKAYDLKTPTATLSSILENHSISQVDFLSLDVEGFEIPVLNGIDFNKHRPKYMLIEARYRKEIDSILSPLYEPIADLTHHDTLYKLSNIKS